MNNNHGGELKKNRPGKKKEKKNEIDSFDFFLLKSLFDIAETFPKVEFGRWIDGACFCKSIANEKKIEEG